MFIDAQIIDKLIMNFGLKKRKAFLQQKLPQWKHHILKPHSFQNQIKA